ncbi:MAG: restriction endonuclease subunit S, partial [Planctomycetes bacterium]|nr:restriction endonuclease subunit S [Planctomycetota bacterium]
SKLPTMGAGTRFRPLDTLVSNIRPYLKKVWVADKEGGASNDVIVIRAKHRLLPQYFSFLLKNDAFIDYVMTGAKGVKMPRGDIGSMKAYPALYPTKPEQQKIADCLASLDERITLEAQKLDTLKTHKKGLMQQLFPRGGENVPRLRFPEFRDAGEWEVKQLSSLATPITRKNKNNSNSNVLTLSSENGLVHQTEYFGRKIASKNTERYIILKLNDFVYNDRTTKASVYGTIKRLSLYQNGIVSPIYKCFRFHEQQNPVFWEYYFESGFHEVQLHSLVNEGARTGRYNISIKNFLSISVWQPSSAEQQKIADCLTALDELITAQADKIETLDAHKKGLMQQLFPVLDK